MNKSGLLITMLALAVCLSGCSYLPSWMGGKEEVKPKLPGERIAVLPVGVVVQPDASTKDMAVSLPAPTVNAEWPQHTGSMTDATGNLGLIGNLDTVSDATAGDGEAFDDTLVPHPVMGGGMVFAMDAVGNISAHDAAKIGKVLWKSKGVSDKDEPEIIGGGLAYDQGRLYATSGRGAVVALDAATGKTIWGKNMRVPFASAPKVVDGKLFAITLDNQLFVLNTATGEVMWNHRGIDETAQLMNAVSPVLAGDTVIVPYSSGELYALAVADGREIWNDSLSAARRAQAGAIFSGIGGDPVVDGSVVFAASNGGMLSVLSLADGRHLWDRPIGSINAPWIAGDYLFMLTSDNTLLCIIKYDGRIRWATKLASYANAKEKKDPITWRGPLVAGGNVIAVSSNGKLVMASAADGKIIATKSIPEGIFAPPIIAGGRMYLMSQDAKLYELQ